MPTANNDNTADCCEVQLPNMVRPAHDKADDRYVQATERQRHGRAAAKEALGLALQDSRLAIGDALHPLGKVLTTNLAHGLS